MILGDGEVVALLSQLICAIVVPVPGALRYLASPRTSFSWTSSSFISFIRKLWIRQIGMNFTSAL